MAEQDLYTAEEMALLKADLGYLTPTAAVETYMGHLLNAACRELAAKGIELDHTDSGDSLLVVMYAAWLYRKRDSSAAMGRMLEYSLRNRIIRSVTGAAEEAGT